ncbi:polycomb group RING finger protein 3 [Lepeophtheirus salmonis]|uniref:polycomb group RING finger protein 3 n=1 Tax=Lepeophtheirus salmonis TaxID=72036 RepID=UPI00077F3E61|nr:polycomb group RING finger protein 3-like [Lepeophtheirus salmonis]
MSGGVDQRRIELRDINEMITCKICQGYLIDATTVTECLHTFCKSCIVKHLEDSNTCPECEDTIHQSHPLDYIAFDRTMQDLVYKIVPNLEKDEYDRERNFYGERGLPCPKDQQQDDKKEDEESSQDTAGEDDKNQDYHRFDEQVSLLLECVTPHFRPLKKKYVRCSSLATVTHLKKFVATKLLQSVDKYKDLDITCDDEPLYKDHTLKFVYVTRWRTKEPPMRLLFAPKKEVKEI